MRRKDKLICKLISVILFIFFVCEYIIYYLVILECSWHLLSNSRPKVNGTVSSADTVEPVKALFIADIHLLGSSKGQWLAKMRREWQMYRSFQSAVALLKPDVIFILGDLFDEGMQCSDSDFQYFIKKLKSMFHVNEGIKVFIVAGNHDIGFHQDITPYLHERFMSALKSPPVQMITLKENHFVLINSMAMEGDGCFICRPAQVELNEITRKLNCAKGVGKCISPTSFNRYSRPIVVQHFPMYRESDKHCSEPDEAPAEVKTLSFHERWHCLSRESSDMIYDSLNPRVIIDAHTHHGCHLVHRHDIHEFTVSSFNWRYKDRPSFILGVFSPDNFTINKCYLPHESTVICLYCIGFFSMTIWIILLFKPRRRRFRMW